jgi:hypothetical protein
MLIRSLALAFVLTTGAVASAQAQSTSTGAAPATREAVRKACAADIKTYCGDLQPGDQMRQCVRDNFAKLSPGCQTALKAMRSARDPH